MHNEQNLLTFCTIMFKKIHITFVKISSLSWRNMIVDSFKYIKDKAHLLQAYVKITVYSAFKLLIKEA